MTSNLKLNECQGTAHAGPERKQKRELLAAALGALGCDADGWNYSSKAGCSCGCSPGFISKRGHGLEVFISIKKSKS